MLETQIINKSRFVGPNNVKEIQKLTKKLGEAKQNLKFKKDEYENFTSFFKSAKLKSKEMTKIKSNARMLEGLEKSAKLKRIQFEDVVKKKIKAIQERAEIRKLSYENGFNTKIGNKRIHNTRTKDLKNLKKLVKFKKGKIDGEIPDEALNILKDIVGTGRVLSSQPKQ